MKVYIFTAPGGGVYYSNDEADMIQAMKRGALHVEVLEMSEEKYKQILTTSEAVKFFEALK